MKDNLLKLDSFSKASPEADGRESQDCNPEAGHEKNTIAKAWSFPQHGDTQRSTVAKFADDSEQAA